MSVALLSLGVRLYLASSQLFDRLGVDHTHRVLAAAGRIRAIEAQLEWEWISRKEGQTTPSGNSGIDSSTVLKEAEAILRALIESDAPTLATQFKPTELISLIPVLQLKALLLNRSSFDTLHSFVQQLSISSSSSPCPLGHTSWDCMAGLATQFHQKEVAIDCINQAIKEVDNMTPIVAAQYWRKLILFSDGPQIIQAYAKIQQWVTTIMTSRSQPQGVEYGTHLMSVLTDWPVVWCVLPLPRSIRLPLVR